MEDALLRFWPIIAGAAAFGAYGLNLLWKIARTSTRTELLLTTTTTQLAEHKTCLDRHSDSLHEHDRRLVEVEGIVRPLRGNA